MSRLLVSMILLVALSSTASAIKCYQCQRTRGNATGHCEADPFVVSAQGVDEVNCDTSCEVRKATFATGEHYQIERVCSNQKHETNCTTNNPMHRPGTPVTFELTRCHCNTDNCNVMNPEAPVLPPIEAHPVKCYACGHHEHGNGTCERQPFNVNAADVEIRDCITSCSISRMTIPAEGNSPARSHIRRECAREYSAEDKCHEWTSSLDADRPYTFRWCTCNTDKCNVDASVLNTNPTGLATRTAVAGGAFFLALLISL